MERGPTVDEAGQVEAFPSPPPVQAQCSKCKAVRPLDRLGSKYGPPQLVGEVKGKRLWEAKCATCDDGATKGMQSIWKEQ